MLHRNSEYVLVVFIIGTQLIKLMLHETMWVVSGKALSEHRYERLTL